MEQTVFCPLRRKRVALTPEENVRQHFIGWLVNSKGYPAELMAAEYFILLNKKKYRCDIVVFGKDLKPIVIVECKAPGVKLNGSVLEQAIRYNMVLSAKYLIITNGVSTFACKLGCGQKGYEFLTDIPSYSQIIELTKPNE